MVLWFYVVILFISFICCIIYYWKMRSYFSVHYTLVFILAFLSHLCYVLLAVSKDLREAIIINKFLYVGGCYFELVGLVLIFSLCKINIPKWIRFIMALYSTFIFSCVMTVGYSPIFYKNVDIAEKNGVTVLVKEYGPLHSMFYIMVIICLVATVFALIYGWFKNPNVSRTNLAIAAFMQIFTIFSYIGGRAINKDIEWVALADLVNEIGFLIIMDRIGLYRVDDLVSSSILNEGHLGYISLDFKKHYLSATSVAKHYFPEIAKNRADRTIASDELRELYDTWIEEFKKENVSKTHIYRRGGFIYSIHVAHLYDGKRKRGYLLVISDDTAHQQHLEGIERYNKNLNNELIVKTKLIQELQNKKSAE